MSRITRTTRLWLLGAVASIALAGTAYATIPAGDGVIHGCYAKSGGTLRVIDASVTNCKAGETALNWSQQGVPGPTGEPGPAGPQGEQGKPGAPGGLAGYQVVSSQSERSSFDKFEDVRCPAGKVAVGGGAHLLDAPPEVALDLSSVVGSDGLGWAAGAHEVVPTDGTWSLTVDAVCVDAA
jgi:hypothetical protein